MRPNAGTSYFGWERSLPCGALDWANVPTQLVAALLYHTTRPLSSWENGL